MISAFENVGRNLPIQKSTETFLNKKGQTEIF